MAECRYRNSCKRGCLSLLLWEAEDLDRGCMLLRRIDYSLVFGLGLYMALRRLNALAMGERQFPIELELPANSCFLIGMVALVVLSSWRNWLPSRRFAVLSGIANALGMVLPFSDIGFADVVGRLLVGFSYPALTVCFGMAVVYLSQREKTATASLSASMVVCAVVVFVAQKLPELPALAVFLCVSPLAVGLLLAWRTPYEYMNDGLARSQAGAIGKKEAVLALAAIALGHSLCSMLNGVSTEYFVLSSEVMLFSCFLSAVVASAYLVYLLSGSAKRSAPFDYWPLVLIALVICLIGFSSSMPIDTTVPYGISFTGLTLFYFASWIICPVIIQRSRLPFVLAFGLISIVCYGYYWRMIGTALRGSNDSVFSTSFFGILTIAFLIVLVVAFTSTGMKRTVAARAATVRGDSRDNLAEKLAASYSLSDREREVCGLALEGFSASKIAEKLFISESTVRFHLKNIYRKCQVKSKQDLLEKLQTIPIE